MSISKVYIIFTLLNKIQINVDIIIFQIVVVF